MHVAATSSYLNSVNFHSARSARMQARAAVSSGASSSTEQADGVSSGLSNPELHQKLSDYSKVQSAFEAAIKTGQSIEGMDLFAPIN